MNYDIDNIYALRIENTSESDPSGYETTKAQKKNSEMETVGVRPCAKFQIASINEV